MEVSDASVGVSRGLREVPGIFRIIRWLSRWSRAKLLDFRRGSRRFRWFWRDIRGQCFSADFRGVLEAFCKHFRGIQMGFKTFQTSSCV